jgi:hypothetical protein
MRICMTMMGKYHKHDASWLPSQWVGRSNLGGSREIARAQSQVDAAEDAARKHYRQHEGEYIDNARAHMEADFVARKGEETHHTGQ